MTREDAAKTISRLYIIKNLPSLNSCLAVLNHATGLCRSVLTKPAIQGFIARRENASEEVRGKEILKGELAFWSTEGSQELERGSWSRKWLTQLELARAVFVVGRAPAPRIRELATPSGRLLC